MTTLTYQGLLCLHTTQESSQLLYLSTIIPSLAEELRSRIARKTVSVRYWITDKETSKEQAQEEFLKKLMGIAECDFGAQYSEHSGYLWTDEECKIGGHDLISELKNYAGKWLILEIDIHSQDAKKTRSLWSTSKE